MQENYSTAEILKLEYDVKEENPFVWLILKDIETQKKFRFCGIRMDMSQYAMFVNQLGWIFEYGKTVFYISKTHNVLNQIIAIGTKKEGNEDRWLVKTKRDGIITRSTINENFLEQSCL